MKRSDRSRTLQAVVVVLATMAILAWGTVRIARTRPLDRWLSLVVTRALEWGTGERAAVGGVTVRPGDRSVTVDGLVLMSRSTGDTIAAARGVTARVGRVGLRPVLETVEVDRPHVTLHLDPDGLREFRNRAGGGGDGPATTPWRALRVRDGVFDLRLPDGALRVEDLDLEPEGPDAVYALTLGRVEVGVGPISQVAEEVRLDGLVLDLGRVVAPDFDLCFPQLSVEGDLALVRDGPTGGRVLVTADLAGLDPALGPGRTLEGVVRAWVHVAETSDGLTLDGTVAATPIALHRARADGTDAPLRVGAMEGTWSLGDDGTVDVGAWRAAWAEGVVEGSARWQPLGGALAVRVETRDVLLESLLADLGVSKGPWVDMAVDLHADLAGQVRPFGLAGPFTLDGERFAAHGGPIRRPDTHPVLAFPWVGLGGHVALDGGAVALRLDRVSLPRGTRGTGTVRIGATGRGPLEAALRLDPVVLSDFAPLGGLGLGGRGLLEARVSGPFQHLAMEGLGTVRDLRVFDIPFADRAELRIDVPELRHLKFPAFEAVRGETRYGGNLSVDFGHPLTMDTQILIREGRISDLAGLFLEVPGVEGRVAGTMELSGPPSALDGTVELDLEDARIVGETFPSGRASARMDAGRFTLRALALERAGGRESLLIRGTVGPAWKANFELVSDGLDLGTLDALRGRAWRVEGPLRLQAAWRGTLTEPLFSGRVALGRVRMPGGELPPSVAVFDTEGSRISADARLAGGAARAAGWVDWHTVEWGVDAVLTELPVHPAWPIQGAGQPVEAWIGGQATARGRGTEPPDLGATLDAVRVRWGDSTFDAETPWRLAWSGSAWRLEDLTLRGGATRVRLDLERTAEGALSGEGEGVLDLAWLHLLGPWVGRSAGRAEFVLDLSGAPEAPQVRAEIDLRDVLFRSPYFPHALEGGRGHVTVTPDAITVEPDLTGRVGGGSLRASGWVAMKDGHPVSADFRASVSDARIHYIEDLPPSVLDGDLTFSGPVDALVLGGDLRIRELVFSDRIDWETWILELGEQRLSALAPEERGRYFAMDLGISGEGTGRIRNNVGDARLSANLRVVGDTARPGLLGRIRVDPGGTVFLKEREFDVTRGEISFLDPWSFDPELDFLLESDVQSRLRDYHVYYRIDGPFSGWRASATSDPALSQADINFLLLFGATRDELEDYGGLEGALAWEGVDLLGRELGEGSAWIQRLGTDLRQAVPFDRVDVVTGPSARGSRTASSEPRLLVEWEADALDLTAIGEANLAQFGDTYAAIEKRIGRRVYITGYWASIQEERSLPIGGAWGTEFKVRWEFE